MNELIFMMFLHMGNNIIITGNEWLLIYIWNNGRHMPLPYHLKYFTLSATVCYGVSPSPVPTFYVEILVPDMMVLVAEALGGE